MLRKAVLGQPTHWVSVSVVDTASDLQVVNHCNLHATAVTWTIPGSGEIQVRKQRYRLELFPNPAVGELHTGLDVPQEAAFRAAVPDLTGRVLLQLKPEFLQRGAGMHTLDVDALPAGNYLLRVQLGTEQELLRFVKN